jgi:aminopeptidase C
MAFENVFLVIVRKAYVSDKILKLFQEESSKLPVWYPSGAMMK